MTTAHSAPRYGPESVPVRDVISAIPAYRPGRNPADLARELGLPDAVKLASNETPYGPLPSVSAAISEAVGGMNRYPDNAARAVVRALAERYELAAEQVVAGCGAVSLIQQLVQAYTEPGDEVVFAWPSFEIYPLHVAIAGARGVRVPLRPDHTHDLPAMAAAVTDATRVVFVCNPNNPTSTAVTEAELVRFLDAVPRRVLVVLDEAYFEFMDDPGRPDGARLMRGRPNVAVMRTFSKAYGMAGLRVGYVLADDPAIPEALGKTHVPFSVSSLAQAAAVASLRAADELLERCRAVVAERAHLVARLGELGVELPRSQANFVYLPLGERAVDFAAACEKRGVIVRPYADHGVRVTVSTREENDAFVAVAAAELGR